MQKQTVSQLTPHDYGDESHVAAWQWPIFLQRSSIASQIKSWVSHGCKTVHPFIWGKDGCVLKFPLIKWIGISASVLVNAK